MVNQFETIGARFAISVAKTRIQIRCKVDILATMLIFASFLCNRGWWKFDGYSVRIVERSWPIPQEDSRKIQGGCGALHFISIFIETMDVLQARARAHKFAPLVYELTPKDLQLYAVSGHIM